MITVFIGTYNRIETLQRTVASYAHLTADHQLVIVDNGSDDFDCIDVLDALDAQGHKVYSMPKVDDMEGATENFLAAIRDYSPRGWVAVSEADVCFDGCPPDALQAFVQVAEHTGTAAGPHLRVDGNIPFSYPLRSRVLATETRMLYKRDMEELDEVTFFSKCQTDTTFHLFPADTQFRRLEMNPVRLGPPYTAMHLDWYIDVFRPTLENTIYTQGKANVGAWGKSWIREFWRHMQVDQRMAFELLAKEPLMVGDLCNTSFLLSWCFQYGIGTYIDIDQSVRWLRRAIPYPHPYYWPHEADWMQMIYRNDFSALGWE